VVPRPKKTPASGRMAQTPLAGTGDSVGWFCRCLRSTLFNYDCNLFLRGTFLQRLLPLPDNRGLLPTPKETYDLNSIAVILRISSFRIPTSIFCTKELYNPGFLTSPQCGYPVPTSDDFCGQTRFVIRSWYRSRILFASIGKVHRPESHFPLHFDAISSPILHLINWIPLRICTGISSRDTQTHLKVVKGIEIFEHLVPINLERIDFFTQFQLRSRSAESTLNCRDSKRWVHSVKKTTSQNLWARIKSNQFINFENVIFVARQREHFRVFLAIFLVAQLPPQEAF